MLIFMKLNSASGAGDRKKLSTQLFSILKYIQNVWCRNLEPPDRFELFKGLMVNTIFPLKQISLNIITNNVFYVEN